MTVQWHNDDSRQHDVLERSLDAPLDVGPVKLSFGDERDWHERKSMVLLYSPVPVITKPSVLCASVLSALLSAMAAII